MLQITTKKFFTTDELNIVHHKAVLYSNYDLLGSIETASGSLARASLYGSGNISSLIYEVDEPWPTVRPDGTREFLMSVGPDFIVDEFAIVSSFALNAVVTSNIDLLRRLILPKNLSTGRVDSPSEYIRQFFDPKISCDSSDVIRAKEFFAQLVGMKRSAYKAVVRAIRRYVVGLHRIGDDLDLSYALLVASIESLAQEFDLFEPKWEDLAQQKRLPIDKALENASAEISNQVRATILSQEHVALGRRFQEFSLDNLNSSFFREEAEREKRPVRKSEIALALAQAYSYRSLYVHRLQELPRKLTTMPNLGDIEYLGRTPVLSLHGLARLVRHIIFEFVRRAEKVEREDIDYLKELPNTVNVQLAPSFWLSNAEGINYNSGRRYLAGFISEFSPIIAGDRERNLTDVRQVMAKIEHIVPGLSKVEQRLPLLTFYLLFHFFTSDDNQSDWRLFIDKYQGDFLIPSPESLLTLILVRNTEGWTIQELVGMRETYMKSRFSKNGLNLGHFFDSAITLYVAEECRKQGEESLARNLIGQAIEETPGNKMLISLEKEEILPEIDWREYLILEEALAEIRAAEKRKRDAIEHGETPTN